MVIKQHLDIDCWFSNKVLYAFLISIILFPAILLPLKYSLLYLLGVCTCWLTVKNKGRLALHNNIFVLWLFYLCLGLLFILWGLIHYSNQFLPMIGLYVVYPTGYMVVVALIRKYSTVVNIIRLLILCTIPIAALVIMQSMAIHTNAAPVLGFLLGLFPEDGLTSGLSYSPRVLPSLVFLLPFTFGCAVAYSKENAPLPRVLLWFSFVLTFGAVLIGERRALLLILLLSPVLILVLSSFLHSSERGDVFWRVGKIILMITIAVLLFGHGYLASVGGFELNAILNDFVEAFAFEHSESAIVRKEQFIALVEGVKERPLFGTGLGIGSDSCIRDPASPWNYELRYVALLFQTGVVGFLLYSLGIIWVLWTGIRIIAAGTALSVHMVPVLAGLCGSLIAEGTNPYLNQFGHLWMLFFPIAVINVWLLNKTKECLWLNEKKVRIKELTPLMSSNL